MVPCFIEQQEPINVDSTVSGGKEDIMSQTMLAIANLGPTEIMLIVLVIFLLFGATRLPQLAKALGQSKKAFRDGIEEGEKEVREVRKESEKTV